MLKELKKNLFHWGPWYRYKFYINKAKKFKIQANDIKEELFVEHVTYLIRNASNFVGLDNSI